MIIAEKVLSMEMLKGFAEFFKRILRTFKECFMK
jgi:hypothetical protein